MIRLAHLSDLHLNGGADRRARLVAGLRAAKRFGATHLALTGDLTRDGRPERITELGQTLQVFWSTEDGDEPFIVPGNHDGDLVCFNNAPRTLGGMTVLSVDTRMKRRALAFRALGEVGAFQLGAIESAASAGPTLVLMHHGPHMHPLQFFDGLVDRSNVLRLLGRYPQLYFLCGHDHRVSDPYPRVHVAASTAHHPEPLRLYDIAGGALKPVWQSTDTKSGYFTFGRRVG